MPHLHEEEMGPGLRLRGLTVHKPTGHQPHPMERSSPAKARISPHGKQGREIMDRMFSEVHEDEPSTVTRANVSGKRKQKMRTAIALEKARKAGVAIPRKG